MNLMFIMKLSVFSFRKTVYLPLRMQSLLKEVSVRLEYELILSRALMRLKELCQGM